MDVERIRQYILSLPQVTEDFPFDDTTLVFRLHGKIFGCISVLRPNIVVLKCDPEKAQDLRQRYPSIEDAYHWNKRYWNQLPLQGEVSDLLIQYLIRHAYNEVVKKLPRKTGAQPIEE